MTDTNIDANGTTLHVEQSGAGDARVVFVHGMCGDARVWNGQVERLQSGLNCVAYDRRGHSRSPKSADVDHTVELHADDLAGLIGALDPMPTIVVGSSGGARVALDFVRRYPDLVRGAVFSEPPIGALAPDEFAAFIGEVRSALQSVDPQDARAAVDAFFATVCPGLWSRIDESTKDRYRDNAPMLFADLGMPGYEISADDIAAMTVPSLVIAGTQSHSALRAAARGLAASLPDVRFLELDCGHVTYAEQPDEFAQAVRGLVSELTG